MPFKKPKNSQDDLIAEQAIEWFSRMQSEPISAREKLQFLNWKAQSPEHKRAYDEITGFLDDTDFLQALSERVLSSSSDELTGLKKSKQSYWLPSSMAACLALLAILFDPFIFLQADYQSEIGHQKTIYLSDGSEVILNTNSALAIDFNEHERRVRLLKGEAYFAVYSNKDRPFIIDSGETETEVLGTKFIVKNNASGDEVSVIEGLVKVSSLNHDQTVQLRPEQQVKNSPLGLEPVAAIKSNEVSAWLNQRLVYKNAPLTQVVKDLERYLPAVIFIQDKSLAEYKINARLDISNPELVLATLQKTLPIKVTELSPWVSIISRSN